MESSPPAAPVTSSYVAQDWIKRARGSDDPVERAHALRQAEPLIEYVDHWTQSAEVWVETPNGLVDARRCAERAVALANEEVSIYCRAAAIFVRRLGDPDRARAILDQCRAALAVAHRTRVGQWEFLGGVYVDLFDDRAAARACLEAAAARTLVVRELCEIGNGYAKDVGDLETARGFIERAIDLATKQNGGGEDGDWWAIANVQRHALDDVDAAWRVLALGLALAKTTSRCIRIAHAVASHGGAALAGQTALRAALARAEDLAAGSEDWLTIADAWHEHMRAHDAATSIRRCLEQAAATGDTTAHPGIAHRYLHLLDDPAAADSFGPVGVAPWDLFTRYVELPGWHADPSILLDVLRPRLTPEMLHIVSCADWGFSHEQHLAVLLDIQRTGLIPQPLRDPPHEVLALTRWTEGVDTDHVARAFACTVLCIDNLAPDFQDAVHESIAPLVESCIVLGGDVLDAAIALLVALCEGTETDRSDQPFYHLGLLLLAAARDPADPRLVDLAERVTRLGDAHEVLTWVTPPGGWLLGITNHDQRHKLWLQLAADVLRGPPHLVAIAERLGQPCAPIEPAPAPTSSYVARDWFKRARSSEDAIARAHCLRQAEALIEQASDWSQVAVLWAETPDGHADARRCAEQAVTLAGEDVGVFTVGIYTGAASVFARHLADPARARAILDQCRAALGAAPKTRVGQWGELCRNYVHLLDDRDAGRMCLEAAAARDLDVRELCELGGDYAKDLGDRDTARPFITRAFERATQQAQEGGGEDGDWWTLSLAFRYSLDDIDGAWRVLDLGLALAKTPSRCIRIAHASASHDDVRAGHTLVRAALERAEALAADTRAAPAWQAWLDIADAWHKDLYEVNAADAEVAIRRCLERATEFGDPAANSDIARRYHRLLEDGAAAAIFGPTGVSPWDLFTRYDEFEAWHADPAALLDLLRARLTSEMLEKIAGADWGFDYSWHLSALRDIQRTGLIPQPLMRHHPHEVLSLSRWSEGIDTDHVARAFVCAVLCIDNLVTSDGTTHSTLAPLIESCILLGGEVLDGAIALVVAMCEGSDYNFEDLAFFNLGLLILAAARDPDDPRLVGLARCVINLGDSQPARDNPSWGWLLGITHYDQRHKLWRQLATDVLGGSPERPHLVAIAERLRLP